MKLKQIIREVAEMHKRLVRSTRDMKVSGVLGGLSAYMEVDATAIRLLYAVITIFTGFFPGIFAYIVAVFIMPKED